MEITVQLASTYKNIYKRDITGDYNTQYLSILHTLNICLDYAICQYNKGHKNYESKIKELNRKKLKLEKECKEIC